MFPRPLILFLLCLTLGVSGARAQSSSVPVVLFPDVDSLTLYVPGQPALISLFGIGFSLNATENQYRLESLTAFSGLPYSALPTPICFRLERVGSVTPLPLECQSVLTLYQQFAAADVFWYRAAIAGTRNVFLAGGTGTRLEETLCPAGSERCDLVYRAPPVAIEPTRVMVDIEQTATAIAALFPVRTPTPIPILTRAPADSTPIPPSQGTPIPPPSIPADAPRVRFVNLAPTSTYLTFFLDGRAINNQPGLSVGMFTEWIAVNAGISIVDVALSRAPEQVIASLTFDLGLETWTTIGGVAEANGAITLNAIREDRRPIPDGYARVIVWNATRDAQIIEPLDILIGREIAFLNVSRSGMPIENAASTITWDVLAGEIDISIGTFDPAIIARGRLALLQISDLDARAGRIYLYAIYGTLNSPAWTFSAV
jgi:hypothetical protein